MTRASHHSAPLRRRPAVVLAVALSPLGFAAAVPLVPVAPAAAADDTVRRTVGDRAVTDARGRRWAPAGGAFRGGRVVRVAGWEPQTGSPALYRRARLGVRSIRLPVAQPGRYSVVLFFADPAAQRSRRVLDISSGGRMLRRGVDVFVGERSDRRPLHALVETVVSGRTLSLRLHGRRGRAVVSAIAATRIGDTTMGDIAPVWSTDFDGPAGTPPDPATWTYETGAEFAHDEQQAYTDRAENASLDGAGNLALTARQEQYTLAGVTRQWTSGRVRLRPRLQLRRAEVKGRMRFPTASGLWATFWLYGLEPPAWPYNGEANVVEFNSNRPRTHHTFFHFGRGRGAGGREGQLLGHTTMSRPLSAGFREYGVRTGPGVIEYRVDGKRTASSTDADVLRGGEWPLENGFNLILSLAVGGDFLRDDTPEPGELPASLLIDRLSYGQ